MIATPTWSPWRPELHHNLTGYWTVLNTRSVPENHEQLETMFNNHCYRCHTSCGDCHVSQPDSVGGGFVDGHNFNATPSMTQNCTACHGSRVGNEYLGKNEGVRADVHFREGRMVCTDCHSSHEMHGQLPTCDECHTAPEDTTIPPADHRYNGVQSPLRDVPHHRRHRARRSGDAPGPRRRFVVPGVPLAGLQQLRRLPRGPQRHDGQPVLRHRRDVHYVRHGCNPIPSYDRPYEYVTLRHVPVATTSFQFYGDGLLSNFDALPTWAYATPHNIQRETPQAASCDACHGVAELFLTADKVAENELNANRNVIMPAIPLPTSGITTTETVTRRSRRGVGSSWSVVK